MILRKSLALGLSFALLASLPAFAGEKKEGGEKKGTGNEITAKVPANYIQLKHMRLAMPEDSTSQYRQLEFEAWISAEGEEKTALLNSSKKKINDSVKDAFANYRWEAFAKPDTGLEVAKLVVSNAVLSAVGIKPDDVIIKTLLLR
jgi:hypothetical protein